MDRPRRTIAVREQVSPEGYHLHIALSPGYDSLPLLCCAPSTLSSYAAPFVQVISGALTVSTRLSADDHSPPLLCFLRLI
jgi:hypothetical protein